jgi:tripartite-type tricarboxylate transporter receptor subunit TctC
MNSGDIVSPYPRALPTNAGRGGISETIAGHLRFSFVCRTAALGFIATAGHSLPSLAQNYPAHALRLILPLAPGGGNDAAARIVGHNLGEALGEQIIVDNRPGGGSIIASELVMKAPPDGHTLYLVSTTFTVAPSLHAKLAYDSLRDFAPITRVTIAPGALIVHPSLPVRTVKDLIALAQARPGQITFGSAGLGTGSHLGGELFSMLAGVSLLHVPYKGSAFATTSVLSGETAVAFNNPFSSLPHIKAGRLRMVAVTTAARWPLLPAVPTIAEAGVPGYEILIWNGLVVHAATPQPIITRLHRELTRILSAPELAALLAGDGSQPLIESPPAFGAFLKNEIAKWQRVVRKAGITAG